MRVYTSTEYFGEGSGIVIKVGRFVIDLYRTERSRFSYGRDGLDAFLRCGTFAVEITCQSLVEV